MDQRTSEERRLDEKIAAILRGGTIPDDHKPDASSVDDDKPISDWNTLSPEEFRRCCAREFGFSPS